MSSFVLIRERIVEVETLCEGMREEIAVIDSRIEDCVATRDAVKSRLSEHELVLRELSNLLERGQKADDEPTRPKKNGKNVRGPLLDWRPLYQILPTKPEDALPISVLRDMVDDEELVKKNRHKFRDQLAKWEKHGVVRRRKTGPRTTSWYRIPSNNGNVSHE
ncbi:MAG: hypothetical protein HWE25_14310 [Alphaproteobacteria bacterium]|nr:hypothetical protein [Alphaproteobacteria bacterium]